MGLLRAGSCPSGVRRLPQASPAAARLLGDGALGRLPRVRARRGRTIRRGCPRRDGGRALPSCGRRSTRTSPTATGWTDEDGCAPTSAASTSTPWSSWASSCWWWATGWTALLLLVATQVFQMVQQVLPLLRFDGYHVLADLAGVPDLYHRIRPTLLGLLPHRWGDTQNAALKPGARAVITLWVLVTVPLMAAMLLAVVAAVPRLVGTAAQVVSEDAAGLSEAWRAGWTRRRLGQDARSSRRGAPAARVRSYPRANRTALAAWACNVEPRFVRTASAGRRPVRRRRDDAVMGVVARPGHLCTNRSWREASALGRPARPGLPGSSAAGPSVPERWRRRGRRPRRDSRQVNPCRPRSQARANFPPRRNPSSR